MGAWFPEAWAVGGGPANSRGEGNTSSDLGEGWQREHTVSPRKGRPSPLDREVPKTWFSAPTAWRGSQSPQPPPQGPDSHSGKAAKGESRGGEGGARSAAAKGPPHWPESRTLQPR